VILFSENLVESVRFRPLHCGILRTPMHVMLDFKSVQSNLTVVCIAATRLVSPWRWQIHSLRGIGCFLL